MTTFAESLKKEIARVARKELREEIAALRARQKAVEDLQADRNRARFSRII